MRLKAVDNVFKCFVYPEIWGLMWRGQNFFRRESVTIGIGSTQIFVMFLLQVRFCFFLQWNMAHQFSTPQQIGSTIYCDLYSRCLLITHLLYYFRLFYIWLTYAIKCFFSIENLFFNYIFIAASLILDTKA